MTEKCKHCGSDKIKLRKSWSNEGKLPRATYRMKITTWLYDCEDCGKSFRVTKSEKQEVLA